MEVAAATEVVVVHLVKIVEEAVVVVNDVSAILVASALELGSGFTKLVINKKKKRGC